MLSYSVSLTWTSVGVACKWRLVVPSAPLDRRGLERGSIITGSSVHNCWVERAHRDVNAGVLCFYAKLFGEMVKKLVFLTIQMKYICFVFITYTYQSPRINKSLEEFVDQMNQRPVSTEHNMSPLQLWTSGMLQNKFSTQCTYCIWNRTVWCWHWWINYSEQWRLSGTDWSTNLCAHRRAKNATAVSLSKLP